MSKFILGLVICLASHNAFADDCSSLAGKWSISDNSGTVISIQADCTAEFTAIAPAHQDEPLTLSSLFFNGTQIRAQYGVKPGTTDENGTTIPNPLPAEIKAQLQGNVFLNADGSLTFRVDFIDDFCKEQSNGGDPLKVCPSPAFVRM